MTTDPTTSTPTLFNLKEPQRGISRPKAPWMQLSETFGRWYGSSRFTSLLCAYKASDQT